MSSFGYVAVNPLGKIKKGSIEAEDAEHVRVLLKRSELTAIEIKEQNLLTKDIKLPFLDRVKARDLSLFCRQFVSIINAGIPVFDALSMLVQQTENVRLRQAILDTHAQIKNGESLSEAMRTHSPKIFPPMMVNMVSAGEASGNLAKAFSRLADHFDKGIRVKNSVKKAMIYPVIVLVAVVAVLAVMTVVVLPEFASVFSDLEIELPLVTKIVMDLSEWMVLHWWKLFLAVAVMIALLTLFGKTEKGRRFYGKIMLKLPIFGTMTVKNASANFARTLGTLIASGLPMLDALELTAKNMNNVYFKDAVMNCRDEAASGASLSSALKESGLFPAMVHHMTGIGEETGELEEMLERLSNYYDEEVEAATKTLIAALEPTIILIMAVMIGLIVCSILIPMFSMYSALGTSA